LPKTGIDLKHYKVNYYTIRFLKYLQKKALKIEKSAFIQDFKPEKILHFTAVFLLKKL
jgi:hypothetical protein